jgi:hypothetical protein
MRGNAIILDTIAKTLNAGGSALVSAYDAGAEAFNCTMSALSPGEKSKLRGRIKSFEKKIQSLNSEIGAVTSKFDDPATALESEAVIAIIGSIKELKHEIEVMNKRIVEIETAKSEQVKQKSKDSSVDPAGVATFFVKSIKGTLASIIPGEKRTIEQKITENEKMVQALYGEFAKESTKYPDPADALADESVKGIIAKINERKEVIAALKITAAEMTAGNKAKKSGGAVDSAADAQKPASVADGISVPAQGVSNSATEVELSSDAHEEVPAHVSIVPEQKDTDNEQKDASVIGYTRSKPYLIPTPELQPPTKEDIEIATRGFQSAIVQDAVIDDGTSPSDEQSGSGAPAASEEEMSSTTVEITSEAFSDTIAIDKSEDVMTVDVDNSVTSTDRPQEKIEVASLSAEKDVQRVSVETHDSTETTEVIEDVAISESENASKFDDNAEIKDEDVPVVEHAKKKLVFDHDGEDEKETRNNSISTAHESSSIRTRSLSSSFSTSSEPASEQVPEVKHEVTSPDDSGTVFRTRAHQNLFATVDGTAEEIVADDKDTSEDGSDNDPEAPSEIAEMVASSRQVISAEKKHYHYRKEIDHAGTHKIEAKAEKSETHKKNKK